MKILLCHNYYQQPGGEDMVFADESALLQSHGHDVRRFEVHNDTIHGRTRIGLARDTLWNRKIARELSTIVRREKVSVVHFHNTFPLISPAAYGAVRRAGAAVVQTLHNFRFLCPSALLLRDGAACEKCIGKRIAWPALAHACYRGSRAATGAAVAMLSAHRAMGTYRRNVDAYIALTEFARRKFIQGGLPGEAIIVKPNFLRHDPGPGAGDGGYAIYVGRLSPEKGIDVLLEAWSQVAGPMRLLVVGGGPLAGRVEKAAATDRRIQLLGWKPPDEVLQLIGRAACLLLPSICYENFPRTIVEALASGTPPIVSGHGAMGELIAHGRTGLQSEPGDAAELASTIRALLDDPAGTAEMRREARREFERRYTAEINYRSLMAVYEKACGARADVEPDRRMLSNQLNPTVDVSRATPATSLNLEGRT